MNLLWSSKRVSDIWMGAFLERSIANPLDFVTGEVAWKLWGKEWFDSLGIDLVQKWVSCKKTTWAFMDHILDSTCEHFSGVFKPLAFREIRFSEESMVHVLGWAMLIVGGSWAVVMLLWGGGVREGGGEKEEDQKKKGGIRGVEGDEAGTRED